jgi:hypothetical protein
MMGICEYDKFRIFWSRLTLTVVLKKRNKMATDNMRLFILALPRPNTNTQTVPQNMSNENPRQLISSFSRVLQ